MIRKLAKKITKKWPLIFNGYRIVYNVFGGNHWKISGGGIRYYLKRHF